MSKKEINWFEERNKNQFDEENQFDEATQLKFQLPTQPNLNQNKNEIKSLKKKSERDET